MKWCETCCFFVIFLLRGVSLVPVTQCVRDKGCTLEELSPGRLNNKDLENGRLPESLSPYHQVIEMQPDIYRPLPPFPLSGHVDIFFNCLEATDAIYINSVGQTINESSLEITVAPESPVQPAPPNWVSFELDEDMQFLIVYLDEMMVEGAQYQLSFDYSATVGNPGFHTSVGLYWDWYEKDDQVRYLVASQFQTSFARYAFPCFDEPAFKATFDVRLSYRDNMKPLSNMPVYMTVGDSEGWLTDYFETTPVMSTYLLAFVVSDFQYVETVTSSGTLVRIWAREDVLHAAQFASSIAGPLQEWYENYTGIAYPLPKQDHIAIPHKGGAMENWGLITYGEYILLWDPDWSTTSGKFSAADVIAHELAHQWFGNLVTCAWWSESWLNEGFATFFEFPPLQDVLGWSGRELQLAESAHVIMTSDTSNQSTAVYYEVTVPWEGGRAFSSYTYNKGGAILRMLVQVLGEATFQRGIIRYLSSHAYSSAVTDDFWTALAEQAAEDGVTDTDGSPLDIKDKFDPWIYQRGHPLITLSPDTELGVLVTQKYFLNPADQEANDPSPWQYQWNIPITFHTGEDPDWNTNTRVWLDRADGIIDEGLPSDPNEWLVANIGHTGFYRVQYDGDTQQAIVQQLLQDHSVIQEGSRAQLFYDTFTLARAKYHDETAGMELTRYLSAERQYVPWLTADKALIYVSLMLSRYPQSFSKYESYIRSLVDPVYLDVGWVPGEDDTYELLSLRNRVLWLTCSYGNAECVDECRRQWGLWQDDTENNPTATDHRLTVYCSSVRSGDVTDWEFAHSRYLVAADNRHPYTRSEIESLLNSMACTEDTTLLQQYLQYTFDPELIHSEDATSAVTALAESDYGGREVVWEHLQDNWRNDPVPEGVNKHNVLLSVVGGFATDADLQDLVNFIDQYPAEDENEDDIYNTALQIVQTNNDWASANQEQLDDWLTEHAPTDDAYNTRHFGRFAGHGMYQKILDSLTASLHQ